jgi:hypothetical protein
MEQQSGTLRRLLTTESALIVEALLAVMLLYYWLGFEITVLSTLAVTTAHVLKVSWRE